MTRNKYGYNVRKEIEQTQTGLTWTKPLNDQQELYSMFYLGNRQVVQYQSIPKCAINEDTANVSRIFTTQSSPCRWCD